MKIPFIRHFRRKLFSLALAIILWFFVTENNVLVDQKMIDIQYRGVPDNVIIVESLQKLSYSVTKNPYYPSDIKSTVTPYVNVDDATPGWHSFPIHLDISPPLPAYANIHPNMTTARILLDNRSTKSVLIKPDISLSNNQDFSVNNVRITPAIIQISGPESVLENIKSVFLSTVNISHQGDYKLEAKLIAPANNISMQTSKVSLQFSVTSNYQTATLTVPITYKNLSPNLQLTDISVPSFTLRIRGLSSEISALRDNVKSIAYIDLLNVASRGVYSKIPLKLDIPNDVIILNPRNVPMTLDASVEDAPLVREATQEQNSSSESEETSTTTPPQEPDSSNPSSEDTDKHVETPPSEENSNSKPSQETSSGEEEKNPSSDLESSFSSQKYPSENKIS